MPAGQKPRKIISAVAPQNDFCRSCRDEEEVKHGKTLSAEAVGMRKKWKR